MNYYRENPVLLQRKSSIITETIMNWYKNNHELLHG